jgi:hypothetical protein
MMASGFKPGDRVYHPKWKTAATVVTILDDDSIGIKCDNAQFTETEVSITDVDQISGQGDPRAPMAILDPASGWSSVEIPDDVIEKLVSAFPPADPNNNAKCPYCGQTFYAMGLEDPIKHHVQYCPEAPPEEEDE